MSEHMLGPWRISKNDSMTVISPNGTIIADCNIATIHRKQPSDEQLCANAAFIVRACNAHDDLLAAAKAMIADRDRPHGFPDYAWYEASFAKLRAAIAKATETAHV